MARRSVALAVLLLLSAMLGSPVHAAPSEHAREEADVAAYADHFGVSKAEAIRRIDETDRIAELEAMLEAEYPEIFAGLWIAHDPTYRVVVAVVDGPPGLADYAARPFGIASPIEQRDATYTMPHLVAIADDLRAARKTVDYSVKVDVRENRVVVRTLAAEAYAERHADVANRGAPAVSIVEVPRLGGPAIYGGLHGTLCTFGFTVRRIGTSIDGITTAAHCQDAQSYSGTTLPFQAASNGSADTQWHTTPGMTDEAKFRYNSAGNTRPVAGTRSYANVVIGQTICKYGRTTGYGCGEVEEKEADAHWVPGQTGRYISLKRCNSDLSTEGTVGGRCSIRTRPVAPSAVGSSVACCVTTSWSSLR